MPGGDWGAYSWFLRIVGFSAIVLGVSATRPSVGLGLGGASLSDMKKKLKEAKVKWRRLYDEEEALKQRLFSRIGYDYMHERSFRDLNGRRVQAEVRMNSIQNAIKDGWFDAMGPD